MTIQKEVIAMPNRVVVGQDRAWFKYWPKYLPKTIDYPEVPLFEPLEATAKRYPNKPAIIYYGRKISYREVWESVLKMATYLKGIGVRKGDRVAINLPNGPHFVIAYYGILRANAVVVSTDPMLSAEGLKVLIDDSGAKALVVMANTLPLVKEMGKCATLEQVIAGEFVDYLPENPEIPVPGFMQKPVGIEKPVAAWKELMAVEVDPPEVLVGCDDDALIMYTSGTTGERKGALHTHWNMVVNSIRPVYWMFFTSSSVHLSVLPFFHITGMHFCMTGAFYSAGTIVILSRWDREAAVQCVEKYRVTHWVNITTMVVDMLTMPDIDKRDLSSFIRFGGGGQRYPRQFGKSWPF